MRAVERIMRGDSRMTRILASLTFGLSIAGIALAACSSLDPHPPDPHNQAPLESIVDGGEDAAEAGP